MKRTSDVLSKLRYENENTNVIHLWLEGMFWKAYERSAYLFVNRISGYKPYKKFVKAVGGEVVAIGFPTKALGKLLEGRSVEYIDDKHYILNGFTIDTQELKGYQLWKKGVASFPYYIVETEKKPPEEEGVGGSLSQTPVSVKEAESPAVAYSQPLIHSASTWALVEEIRRFRMESSTPLECMMFLAQLIKKSLDIHP